MALKQAFGPGYSNITIGFVLAAVALRAATAGSDSLPLLADCSDPSSVVATIHTSDPVRVRYSLGGGRETCYAVAVTKDGKTVDGFVVGAGHPDVAEFERAARLRVPEIPPPPPPPPAVKNTETKPAADAQPPLPSANFAGLRGKDKAGRTVDVGSIPARFVVVYFWTPGNKRLTHDSEALEAVQEEFRKKSVQVVGVASHASLTQLRAYGQEVEAAWPIIHDDGGLTARYKVNPAIPYYILDARRNVVAAVASATQIAQELRRLRNPG
jgi:hypothetical protein